MTHPGRQSVLEILRTLHVIVVLTVVPALAAPDSQALPAQVVAFSNDRFPIADAEALRAQGVDVHVFNLDQMRNLEQEIDARLPGNQVQAEAVAKRVIGAYRNRLIAGWRGIAQAIKWQIHSLPAVVFDRSTVLYGEPDLERATARWREGR